MNQYFYLNPDFSSKEGKNKKKPYNTQKFLIKLSKDIFLNLRQFILFQSFNDSINP